VGGERGRREGRGGDERGGDKGKRWEAGWKLGGDWGVGEKKRRDGGNLAPRSFLEVGAYMQRVVNRT